MKIDRLLVGIVLILCALTTFPALAQDGDQFLDGIGETGLISRYQFKGNDRDWSRNNLHAITRGTDFRFIPDSLFGNVLALSGESETYVSIPGEAVSGEESLTITGWIWLRDAKPGQLFFDFGKDSNSHFFAAPAGTKEKPGLQTAFVAGSKTYTTSFDAVPLNKWSHLAVVLDIPAKTMSTYLNGMLVVEVKDAALDISQLFDNDSEKNNQLYVGKSIDGEKTFLNASRVRCGATGATAALTVTTAFGCRLVPETFPVTVYVPGTSAWLLSSGTGQITLTSGPSTPLP